MRTPVLLILALIANKFRAAGQVCVCANRVFVHHSVMDKFAAIMKEKISRLKFGHGLEPGRSKVVHSDR